MLKHARPLSHGHMLRVEVGPLGAGTNWSYYPQTRTWVEPVSITIVLATDANVANRRVYVVFGGTTDDDVAIGFPMVQLASSTASYGLYRGIGIEQAAFYDGRALTSLPQGLLIQNPEQVRTEIVNLQAGDVISSVRARFRMWYDPVTI